MEKLTAASGDPRSAIAREKVKLHGGEIGLSRRRQANWFWLEIPMESDHLAPHEIASNAPSPAVWQRLEILSDSKAKPAHLPHPPSRHRNCRVLIAEDNPDLRKLHGFSPRGNLPAGNGCQRISW